MLEEMGFLILPLLNIHFVTLNVVIFVNLSITVKCLCFFYWGLEILQDVYKSEKLLVRKSEHFFA